MKVLLCCSALVLALNLCAAENDKEIYDESNKETPDENAPAASSAKDFAGVFLGAGVNIGVQRKTAEINREFRDRSESVNSTNYGGTFTIGYHYPIAGNCFIGIEAGADFGSESAQHIGGILKTESAFAQREFLRRDVLRQMMQGVGMSFKIAQYQPGLIGVPMPVGPSISGNVWENFVRTIRYLGGGEGEAAINDFITRDAHLGGVFADVLVDPNCTANPNATFANFLNENTRIRIAELGNGSIIEGFREIKSFLQDRLPNLADAFNHMAEIDIREFGGAQVLGTRLGGGIVGLTLENVYYLYDFFAHQMGGGAGFDTLGVNRAALFDQIIDEMNNLYYAPQADLVFPADVNEVTVRNVETKTSFGVCPHLALKAGCFLKKLNVCLYAKFGAIQLNGHVTPVNNIYGLREEKFKVIAPFVAVGATKSVDENWGIGLELFHAFKRTKKLQDTRIFRHTIENRTCISKTGLRLTVSYKL
ncbi:MAG: hypothetical protein LBJ96_04325 [Holosporaceae bacterium]|nr:hypothetical protein [Holosporaceae bacterium]